MQNSFANVEQTTKVPFNRVRNEWPFGGFGDSREAVEARALVPNAFRPSVGHWQRPGASVGLARTTVKQLPFGPLWLSGMPEDGKLWVLVKNPLSRKVDIDLCSFSALV
jgi:hypothetical protein